MIDLNAPIIPGQGAAGILIGTSIHEVTEGAGFPFFVEHLPDGTQVFRSSFVDLWVKQDKIFQIMVHGQYKGKLANVIGIGSSLNKLEETLGTVALDEEDNLTVENMPGFCFEIDPDVDPSTIVEIYVY